MSNPGHQMYELCSELFPICRSLSGNGVRQTLAILKTHVPQLAIHEVPTGTQCLDWQVPNEWNIADAYVIDPDGRKILDFKTCNLHVVGYSTPVDITLSLDELQGHLHSLPDQPNAIPYMTSYYKERWGFCLTHEQRQTLKPGQYHAVIQSELKPGHLTYGELLLPGESQNEILLSTYVCHPSMGNNELSGPVVTTFLAKWLSRLQSRRYTYRILFLPEMIGSAIYLSRHLQVMKHNTVAGFVITCIGDNRSYSFMPSRHGHTLADQVAQHVLHHMHPDYKTYSYLERGSDERNYCSPGVDLPVASVMRTKYAEYPEYHTSLDNLDLISADGLAGGFGVLQRCLECLEHNHTYQITVLGEPQLGKRGLYPSLSTKDTFHQVYKMINLLAFADGKLSLLELANTINVPMWELFDHASEMLKQDLLRKIV